MTVTIITVCRNSSATISATLKSVAEQSYSNIEHIIIDGNSTDNTMDIVKEYPHIKKAISEPDKGIYDAMNKGIAVSTGDIVGLLNSDDFFANNEVISKIVSAFLKKSETMIVFGDVWFVSKQNTQKVVRTFLGTNFHRKRLQFGFAPPHPTVYVRRNIIEEYGDYDLKYTIAADFEWMLRVFKISEIKFEYLKELVVKMRDGGTSNSGLYSKWKIAKEMTLALKTHKMHNNILLSQVKFLLRLKDVVENYVKKYVSNIKYH